VHDNNLSKTGNINFRFLDTKIASKVEEFSKQNGLYKDFMKNTFERLNSLFYYRFYSAIYRNIKNKYNILESIRYFLKTNPYSLISVLFRKFKNYD